MGNIKYLFFDCDNTLVLSEDPASEICSILINEILKKHGVSARYSPEDLISSFVGLNCRRILTILQQEHNFILQPEELNDCLRNQEDLVIANIYRKARPCPGVVDLLTYLHGTGKYVMAVVSSSSLRRIRACLDKAGLLKFFDDSHIFPAAGLSPPSSKPDPAVYLHALKVLGAKPGECLTVEDSMSGLQAALGAKLFVLGYVGSTHTIGSKQEMAVHLMTAGCTEILWHWGEYLENLAEVASQGMESARQRQSKIIRGRYLRADEVVGGLV